MGNKTLSVLAAALFAASVGTSQPACVSVQGRVINAIEHRDAEIRKDLDEIVRSVHCVRTRAEYVLEGAEGDHAPKARTTHGTAFAYMRKGGYTYLVTNAHVVDEPEQVIEKTLGIGPEGLEIVVRTYNRSGIVSHLVDDGKDSDASDDISVEVVAKDDEADIAVLRTGKKMPVADTYRTDLSFDPDPGDEAYIVGYPRGSFPAVTRGVISNEGHDFSDGNVMDVLDVNSTFGNSGSPYFVRRGDTLYWTGTVGQVFLHPGHTPMMSIGIPIIGYADMLDDPEAYAAAHATADEEDAESAAKPDVSPDAVGGGA